MSVSEPGKIITPWAESGLKNTIPPTANPATGRAGFDQGFSAINMTAKEAGGIPPFGQDFNGIFYEITKILQYMQAGGQPTFDADFAAAIGGYPAGAILSSDDGMSLFRSVADGNATDPNLGGEGWARPDLQIMELYRRSYAEAGYNLVDGSFEVGGALVNDNDVLLHEASGKAFSGPTGDVAAGTNPASGGFVDVSGVVASHVLLESFGYGFAANTPAQNYEALQKFYSWLGGQTYVGTIIHPPRRVDIQTTVTANNTKFLGTDITALKSFIFDFNGGQMNDLTDVSASNAQHVIFVIRNADVVSFINSDVAGSMGDPTSVRGGMTLCRAYNSGYVSFKGKAAGIINHVETRDCGTLEVAAECDTVRYPFLVYRCKSFSVTLNNKNCWRDYFIQGAETGQFHIVSDAPRQHSMLKSYDSAMVNSNIVGYYKARNRTYALESPTGQFGFEIESDEQVIFRNIHITVDIEGNYGRPIMMRNYKANGSNQDTAKGHVLQNIKISGRIRDLSGTTGNLFLVGGGYRAGDFIQSMALDDLTIIGSFVVNVAQMLPAIDAASKMKWRNFTITDGYLESHVTGFYADYISAHNVTFVGKAYSSNNPQSLGSLEFSKRFVGNIVTGIPLFTLDNTRTMNHVVIDYCATASDTSFNPFIEGRLSGLLVYPTSGVVSETTVDTQYAKQGTAGVADMFEVSPGVLGIKIPTWSATAAMLQVRVMVKYHSYGEGDFSSIPGMIYAPYKSM